MVTAGKEWPSVAVWRVQSSSSFVADGKRTWNPTQHSASQLHGMGKSVVTALWTVAGQRRLLESRDKNP